MIVINYFHTRFMPTRKARILAGPLSGGDTFVDVYANFAHYPPPGTVERMGREDAQAYLGEYLHVMGRMPNGIPVKRVVVEEESRSERG